MKPLDLPLPNLAPPSVAPPGEDERSADGRSVDLRLRGEGGGRGTGVETTSTVSMAGPPSEMVPALNPTEASGGALRPSTREGGVPGGRSHAPLIVA